MVASVSETSPRRRGKRVRALRVAIACGAAMLLLSALVALLPISDEARDTLLGAILLPPILIGRALVFLIDSLGPHYLPRWEIQCLRVLSIAFFVALLYGVALAALSWRERRGSTSARGVPPGDH